MHTRLQQGHTPAHLPIQITGQLLLSTQRPQQGPKPTGAAYYALCGIELQLLLDELSGEVRQHPVSKLPKSKCRCFQVR